MIQALDLKESVAEPAAPAPRLLVELESRHRVFLRNLGDLFRPRPVFPRISSPPGPFWQDVFVPHKLPWGRLAESAVCHVLAVAALWGASVLWLRQPHLVPQRAFDATDVVTYQASEYLPPLDTGVKGTPEPQKGEPEFARQPIILVPPNPDNRTQTIVTPPDIKLTQDVPLPNVVAWSNTQIPVPMAATERSTARLNAPTLPNEVVAPAPSLDQAVERRSLNLTPSVIAPPPQVQADPARRAIQAIQPAIIEPPPGTELASTRRVTDLDIGHSDVVAPAPQLPMAEQRSLRGMAPPVSGAAGGQVVAPPPSMQGAGTGRQGGNLIALGIHPVEPTGPVDPPAGNRRGTFAAGPQGKPGASATPDVRADQPHSGSGGSGAQNGSGRGSGSGSNSGVPPGLFVGAGPKDAASSPVAGQNSGSAPPTDTVNPRLMASVTPPRVTSNSRRTAAPVSELRATEIDKRVFGARRFYSLSLNMPNLNSTGGSWVVRFAELKDDGTKGDLLAPEAIKEVDPAYPIELMRRNVQGTVTLHAVIRSDGTVGDISVLNSVDDQLDRYASQALAEWQFRPAEKNGTAIDLEAVVMIPFKPQKKLF